jgi:ATP-dependent helicase/DNAse subunit B
MLDYIEDDSVIVVPGEIKNQVVRDIREKFGLKNIKFITISEFQSKYYFSYDKKAINYLMKKYGWKYEVCLVYLKNLYYVENKKYKYEKLNFLNDLKSELDNLGLLIYSPYFKKSLEGKHIYVLGFRNVNLFYKNMFDSVSKNASVSIIDRNEKHYQHDTVYEFETIEDEVNFVAIKIIELINNGVDINKIKLANVSGEYIFQIRKIFGFYNICVSLDEKTSLYSTSIGRYFFEVLESDVKKTLELVSNKYANCNDEYNLIVDILNEYSWVNDFNSIKDMLIYDFRNTYIKKDEYENQIECINISNSIIDDEVYVFLLGFNQGIIPKIHQDEEYITDAMKEELGVIESTVEKNKIEKSITVSAILAIKNLVISYKKESSSGSFIISNLNDEIKLNVIADFKDNYSYSNIYNKLRLCSAMDEYAKYGVVFERLPILFNNYSDIDYLTYNNKFTSIDKVKLQDYLKNKLLLSYSTIDNFYRCGFRYYIGNILKLSIFEDTFMTTLGSLFHYILSLAFVKEDFDLDFEYQDYIEKCGKTFSKKEQFFLKKLKEELRFIIASIKEQMEYCRLDMAKYEEEIYIDKSSDMNITFMGIVDKIIYGEENGKSILSIIDYKTGNPKTNLNHTIYGIEMQLPVYLYLVSRSGKFTNVDIAGFYLQKILNSEISRDNKHTYVELKRNNLKLQGYSNENIGVLGAFDSSFDDSKVVKSLKTTSKGFAHYSKVISSEKIERLEDIVDEKIDGAFKDIRDAKFDINPKRIGKDNLGCEFCKFRDICFMRENDVVNLKEYKNLEFLSDEEAGEE